MRTSAKQGFSLLESLIALAFLALAALGVMASFLFATRLDTKREAQHQAALLALDSMEEARALLREDLKNDVTASRSPHPEVSEFQIERKQKWIGAEAGLPENALKEVRVEVFWGSLDDVQSYPLEERFVEFKE